MRIFRRIDRVLVVAMVLLAMLASGCDPGSEQDLLDALIENAEEPAGTEREPGRISGPVTVFVGTSAEYAAADYPSSRCSR